jgi:hypothetical protein
MSPVDGGLMRLLGVGGATPFQASPGMTRGQVEGADFASLLREARQGGVASGRPVTLARGAAVNLSADQLERLAAAADRAEAEGATRALVIIDGQALRLDVTTREITGAVDLTRPGVMGGIDAVVTLPPAEPKGPPVPLPGAGPGLLSPSLLKALAGTSR